MLKSIGKLFATSTKSNIKPAPKRRLSVEALEDRAAPAVIANPGITHGFNPQPDPPVSVRVVLSPGVTVGGWSNHNETIVRDVRRKVRRK